MRRIFDKYTRKDRRQMRRMFRRQIRKGVALVFFSLYERDEGLDYEELALGQKIDIGLLYPMMTWWRENFKEDWDREEYGELMTGVDDDD